MLQSFGTSKGHMSSLLLQTSFFVRGRRQGRQPLNPGAGPGAAAPGAAARGSGPWHCRRPSVVTEGYIRLPPLPPTHLVSIRVHPRSTILPVIYSVFCVWCSKNIVFLQGFVAFAVSRFHLGDVKKPWVFHGFGSAAGVRNGQLAVLTALVPT